MVPSIIARNYAETLLALAHRHGGDAAVEEYGAAIGQVADLLQQEPLIREFLETPKVDLEAKKNALVASLKGRVPEIVLRFLLVVLEKRRQGALRQIADEYQALVDEERGWVRAEITLAREPDEGLRREIVGSLERRLGRTVVAQFQVDPSLVGGIMIRAGGEVLDGSIRSRTVGLRRRLLEAHIPVPAAAAGS